MTSKESRPIFVVGAPRSGTTLFQYMLRSHPGISLPTGESHFFVPLFRSRDEWGDLSDIRNVKRVLEEMMRRSKDFLLTDLHGVEFDIERISQEISSNGICSIPDIFDYIYTMNARGEGKARWGDKTPYYVLHMPMLQEMFPEAQFIHIIRDGRDCALSLLQRRDDFGVYNFHMAGRYWRQYIDKGRELGRKISKDQYLEVKYEDLLGSPKETMRKVMGFLGEEYDESLINFKKSKDPNSKTPLVARPISASNREKWKNKMSNWDIRVFESAAGAALAKAGYDIETSCEELPFFIRGGYRLHNNAVKRMRRRNRNR